MIDRITYLENMINFIGIILVNRVEEYDYDLDRQMTDYILELRRERKKRALEKANKNFV